MRIQNSEVLSSHGNVEGRKAALAILEAGLAAADPYTNTRKLLRLEKGHLLVGHPDYEPAGTPRTGTEVLDLAALERIYVFGAGKGCQRVAKALEDVLGDALTGGHVIDKKGHDVILQRIGVTLGAHPVPDEDCVRGCERILAMAKGLTEKDLVFTIAANGISALLTMPVPDVSIEDVRATTYLMQITRGAPTGDLNPIRNHLDQMKGGRITRHLAPAKMIHILAIPPGNFDQLMHRNLWLHTLPDYTTFQLAIDNLKKWDAWDAVPPAVRRHLTAADPQHETVKAMAFDQMDFRIFGVMPPATGMIPTAMAKAATLGYTPVLLAQGLHCEASQAGLVVATIARTIEQTGQPLLPPCALFTGGELLVTVGEATGMGGRNQEFVLGAAQRLRGSQRIVMGAADSDGTDGPGTQFVDNVTLPCLGGGVVDGKTMDEAAAAGLDVAAELKRHNASLPLWRLQSGIVMSKSISINDLSVTLIMRQTDGAQT